MKALKTGYRVSLIVLASAVLGFGEMNSAAPRVGGPNMALPGTVNYVEGQVSLDNRPLANTGKIAIAPGQTLSTGNGFAEVLLTPGAFLRLGNNSQVRLLATGLAQTSAQLDRGSTIVEVDQFIQGTNLAVTMGGANTQIEKKGLYDFGADQQSVKVLDGKVNVMTAAGSKTIGKDDQISLASENPLKKTGFDAKALKAQPLYVWSEARSRDESQANVAVAENVASYGGWYGPGWYWNPDLSFYAYLPANGYFYSPFGWGFYSPLFIRAYGIPFGYYGHYGRSYGAFRGQVGGVSAHAYSFHGGMAGGFHGGRR